MLSGVVLDSFRIRHKCGRPPHSNISDPAWKDDVIGFRRVDSSELQRLGLGQYQYAWFFTTIITDATVLLAFLLDRFRKLGGQTVTAKVDSLELEALRKHFPANSLSASTVVVNCTGIGALPLCGDTTLRPCRGQTLRVKAPYVKHFFDEGLGNKNDNDPSKLVYVFPRLNEVLLGGTYEENQWDRTSSQETAEGIRSRCAELVPELRHAPEVKRWVGLRPVRPTVRLEWDAEVEARLRKGACSHRLIHNYGHGGSGLTLFWGCAQEVATKVHQQLTNRVTTPISRL